MALPRSPPSPRRWSPRGAPTSPTRETRIRAGGACVERELASFSACGENRRSADSSGAIEDCSAPAREPPAGSELGHGAGSSRRRRRSAARSDVGCRCAGGIRPTLDAGISDELLGTGRRSCDSNPRPRTNGWRAPLPTQCHAAPTPPPTSWAAASTPWTVARRRAPQRWRHWRICSACSR